MKMTNLSTFEKSLSDALQRVLENAPPDEKAVVTVETVYNALSNTMQKRLQRSAVHHFLQVRGFIPDSETYEESPTPQSSQNSSASEDFGKDSDDAVRQEINPPVKKKRRGRPPNRSRPPQPAVQNGTVREGRRAIKRKQMFDPSDPVTMKQAAVVVTERKKFLDRKTFAEKRKYERKSNAVLKKAPPPSREPSEEPEEPEESEDEEAGEAKCKICRGTSTEIPPDAKQKEPQVCGGCNKAQAHAACVEWEAQPWKCNSCKLCIKCNGPKLPRERLLVCKLCKESYHPKCANVSKRDSTGQWFCRPCAQAFSDDGCKQADPFEDFSRPGSPSETKVKTRKAGSSRRPSLLSVDRPIEVDEEENDSYYNNDVDDLDKEEIPNFSEWTPEQVYSYFLTYVPAEHAQAFLDLEIDGRCLNILQRNDVLKQFKLELGPALKVYAHVKRLQKRSYEMDLTWM